MAESVSNHTRIAVAAIADADRTAGLSDQSVRLAEDQIDVAAGFAEIDDPQDSAVVDVGDPGDVVVRRIDGDAARFERGGPAAPHRNRAGDLKRGRLAGDQSAARTPCRDVGTVRGI